MIEQIIHNSQLLAIIIYANYSEPGVNFLTPDNFSQQLAFMKHPQGKEILPHVHNPVAREVHFTKEVLVIKKGKLRVDFYTDQQVYIESRVLAEHDVILLSEGGHGFKVIEDLEMIEIKHGPYAGEQDKTRFSGISDDQVKIGG